MATAVYKTEGPLAQRLAKVAMFMFPYLVLTGIASLAMKSSWVFVSFWGLMVNRWTGPLLSRSEPSRKYREVMVSWIVCLGLYCLIVPFIILVPVPALGLEGYHIAPGSFPVPVESSGSREFTLQQLMAAGALYFLLSGLSELFGHRWVPERWRLGTARPR